MITITGPLQLWSNEEGRVHFMVLPEPESNEVRAHALMYPRGFRSVKVECKIGEVTWRTSLFPQKSGGYFLPIKADVCRRVGIAPGDQATVELTLF